MTAANRKCIKTAGLKLYVLPGFFFASSAETPSSLARRFGAEEVAGPELVGATWRSPQPLAPQANAVPKTAAFSNRRFSYMFAPPSTQPQRSAFGLRHPGALPALCGS